MFTKTISFYFKIKPNIRATYIKLGPYTAARCIQVTPNHQRPYNAMFHAKA